MGSRVEGAGARARAGSAALLGFSTAVVGGFGLAVRSAMSFESGMSAVEAATGATGDSLRALNDEALRIGATTTQSATGAAQAMELLAKAGITTEQILEGAAQSAVNLAEATGEALPQAAESMAAVMNLWKDLDASRAADIWTAGLNASSATMSEFQTGIANLAPVVAATGMSFEESAALVAYFNAQGLSAAEAGSSLTTMFNDLSTPTAETAQAMADLGINAYDAQGKFVGLPSIFEQVARATDGMSDAQRDAALDLLFSDNAMDVAALGAEGLGESYDAVRASMDETGTAAEASATRMNNLSGDVEGLKGTLESVAITVGRMLTPVLRTVTQRATAFVGAFLRMPSGMQRAIAVALGLTAAIAGLAGGIGLLIAGSGPLVAGLGAIGAGIALLLSPVGLLAAALIGLAFVFKSDLVNGISAAGDRVGEFFTDIGDVFTRLRDEGKSGYYDGRGVFVEVGEGASVASASIRAFGSALEDLTGIETSAFFGNLAQAADAFFARDWSTFWDELKQAVGVLNLDQVVVNFGGFVWGTAIPSLWNWIKGNLLGGTEGRDAVAGTAGQATVGNGQYSLPPIDIPEMAVNLLGYAWGKVADLASWVDAHLLGGGGRDVVPGTAGQATVAADGLFIDLPAIAVNVLDYAWGKVADLTSWVKTNLLGSGGRSIVPGTAGQATVAGSLDYDMPPVLVNVLDYVEGEIKDAWEWAKPRITGQQDTPPEVTVGPWTAVVPPPTEVESKDAFDYIDQFLESHAGVDIELQNWKFRLANEPGNLQVADFVRWVDDTLEDMIGIDVEIQDLTVRVKNPDTIANAQGVIDHMDLVLERMFAGGHKVELQNIEWSLPDIGNPWAGLQEKVGGWLAEMKGWFGGGGGSAGGSRGNAVSWEGGGTPAIIEDFLNGPIKYLIDFKMPDIPNPFAGLGDQISGWASPVVDAVNAAADALEGAWKRLESVKALFGGGGGASGAGRASDTDGGSGAVPPGAFGGGGGGVIPGFGLPMQKGGADKGAGIAALAIPAPDLSAFIAAFTDAAAQVTNATLAIESRVTAMATVVTSMGQNAGTGFANTLGTGAMNAATLFTTATLAIEARATGTATTLTVMGQMAGDGFANTLGAGLNTAVAQAGAVQASMVAIGNGIATSMTVAGMNAGTGFAYGVAAGMAQAVASAYAGANAIRGALAGIGNMSGVGFGIGASLGQGIAAGIASQIGAVAAQAAYLVSSAVAAARAAGAIRSPSRVMAELVGKPMGQGVAVGLLGESGTVASAARSLVGAGIVGVPAGVGGGSGAVGVATGGSAKVVTITNNFRNYNKLDTGYDWDRKQANQQRRAALMSRRMG